MSGASKTNSPLVLYAEGVDPEADLVLVCGQRMRLREKKIKEAMLQLKGLHESTTMALFQHLAMMSCENNVQAMDRAITTVTTLSRLGV